MGWWSIDVVDGGDQPWDAKDEIYELCGFNWDLVEKDKTIEPESFITKEKLEAIQSKLYVRWMRDEYLGLIAFQVLGALMVSKGCVFKKKVLKKCIECLELDGWDNVDRIHQVQYLLNVLKNYDNTPTSYFDVDYINKDN